MTVAWLKLCSVSSSWLYPDSAIKSPVSPREALCLGSSVVALPAAPHKPGAPPLTARAVPVGTHPTHPEALLPRPTPPRPETHG